MTQSHNLLITQDQALLSIRLNRPSVLNAMTDDLMRDLDAALANAQSDASVRAILITGEGRGFCAGADLATSALAPSEAEAGASSSATQAVAERSEARSAPHVADKLRLVFNPVIQRMRDMPKPIITAVNGIAAGAGMSLAMAGDIIICAESASFLQAFTKIGLIPDAGSTWFLPRLVGDAKARALVMLAEKMPAREAERIGLVYKVVPDTELAAESLKLGHFLASMPTQAYALIKKAMNQSHGASLSEQLDREAELQAQAATTEDCREGIAAFLEKRPANFKGR
ncbi:MAG: enoyl-CoA hydratase-related protein [Burkholderiales bacterium]|jgi:2-(1,2-epoxy-1,2-dihydrophenyl)acetyl-CoA isomerase|nr:2-(1,2-epoxy-1,2-dihydrophenyl)acetyl-CoA isomerase [Betaproteobacteria bacterium]NBT98958.1 2-(1,2-epoxy-1,2-dihydrophenyl)acetyl-CoA isomerase [Betaproteobacteria bacterium]NDE31064.1 2-(1,2-epoxy-1,2-dihydrophenyl)acetyl-CoA isomerase [Betaproteobacteria bacterium]